MENGIMDSNKFSQISESKSQKTWSPMNAYSSRGYQSVRDPIKGIVSSIKNSNYMSTNNPPSMKNKVDDIDYSLLEQAGKSLTDSLNSDEKYPELYEQILKYEEPHNYFLEPYQSYWKPQIVPKGGTKSMPSAIVSALENCKLTYRSGMLPEIHHAWISIDNTLFLWDYTNNERITVWDEIDQVIVSVAIAIPKPNVFREFVRYVLVVSTPVEVSLVAIIFENNDQVNGKISLRTSKLVVSTDNVNMRKIVGATSGRIFMGGSDGHLHEFVYDSDEGLLYHLGLQSKCRKIQHCSPYFMILPRFLLPQGHFKGIICDMAVDEERNLLWTLSSSSTITLYDLGKSGHETIEISSKHVFSEAVNFCKANRSRRVACPDERVFSNLPSSAKISSISVVPRAESKYIHLVAVSNSGVRFYFSTLNASNCSIGKSVPLSARPSGILMLHVRLPPPVTDGSNAPDHHATEGIQPGFVSGKTSLKIHKAFCRGGVVLMADGGPDEHDRLVGIANDLINRNIGSQYRRPTMRESVSSDTCHGKINEIVEYISDDSLKGVPKSIQIPIEKTSEPAGKRPYSQISSDQISSNDSYDSVVLGEMTTQFSTPQRHFLCLTNGGLIVYKKLRPIDQLHRILYMKRDNFAEVENFFRYFGQIETCSMLFAIACGVSTDPCITDGSITDTSSRDNLVSYGGIHHDNEVRRDAIRAILDFGGHPLVADFAPPSGPASGRLVMTDDIYMSGHHDGLVMFFSRIIRPLWKFSFVSVRNARPTKGNNEKGKSEILYSCSHTTSKLQTIREVLFQLRQLMEQTSPYSLAIKSNASDISQYPEPSRANVMTRMLNTNTSQNNSDRVRQENALRSEQCSIKRMFVLLCRCIEAISLLLYAHDKPKAFSDKRLIRMPFSTFITSPEGKDCSQNMLSLLMSEVLQEPGRVDASVDVLRRECPSFFSVGDAWQFQGRQLLARVKSVIRPQEKQQLLEETLGRFMKASRFWCSFESLEILQDICNDYYNLGYFVGIVDLCLQCASNFRQTGKDLELLTLSEYGSDSILSSEQKSLMKCYGCILDRFQKLFPPSTGQRIPTPERTVDSWLSLPSSEREKVAREALDRALASTDPLFHRVLYTWLWEHNHRDILITISSPYVEDFLKRQDDDMLCNHYVRKGNYSDASLVMWQKAHKQEAILENNYSIADRLSYLTRSLSYAQNASTFNANKTSGPSMSASMVSEIQEKLDVMQLQTSILGELQNDTDAIKHRIRTSNEIYDVDLAAREEDIKELTYTIVDVSALYNKFAMKYKMWENCLAIMHSCQSEDTGIIAQHWKKIIFSLVPLSSGNASVSSWIRQEVLTCGASDRTAGVFEDAAWIGSLRVKILQLGRKLFNSGADFAFPVRFIARELEILWMKFKKTTFSMEVSGDVNENWILFLFQEVRVPHILLWDAYKFLYQEQGSINWQMHILQSMCTIVEKWRENVLSPAANNDSRIEFGDSCPKIVGALEEFTTDLQAMRSEPALNKGACLDRIRNLKHQLLNFREDFFG